MLQGSTGETIGDPMIKEERGSILDRFGIKTRWRELSEERREDIIYLSLIFAVILVFFWKVVLRPDELIYSPNSDTVEQFYPWHYLADESIKGGQLPFWNQYNFGGEPLLANMQLGFFYPPNLILFSVLPVSSAFGFSFILHLFFAGSSTYFLAKRAGLKGLAAFLPGVVFIFSGYFMGHIYAGHYGQVCSASWIPMVLLVLDQALRKQSWKWGLVLGGAVGVQFLAGHIQITIFSGFVCAVYFIYHIILERRTLKRDRKWLRLSSIPIFAIPAAFFIALVQFLLTLTYTDATTRSGGMDYPWVSSYSLPPQNFITLLTPNIFGTPLEGNYWHLWNYWELSFYMGIFTIVLVLLSVKFWKERYPRFFVILGLSSLVMAMGKYTPVYWLFYKVVPGFDILRVPSRFVLIFILCASILSGFGLKRWIDDNGKDTRKLLRRTFRGIVVISSLFLLSALLLTIFQEGTTTFIDDKVDKLLTDDELLATANSILHSAYVNVIRDLLIAAGFLVICGTLIVWKIKMKDRGRLVGAAAVALIVFNLGFYHIDLIDTRDTDAIYELEPHLKFLADNSKGYRVYDASDVIEDNYQIMYGFHTVKGYNPLELAYYQEMMESIRNLSHNTLHPVLDLVGAKYIVTSERLKESGFHLVFGPSGEEKIRIYENPNALPEAFLVTSISVYNDEGVLKRLRDGYLDPSRELLISKGITGYDPSEVEEGPGEITRIERPSSSEVLVDVSVPGDRVLVLSQSFYDEWDVYVDGSEQELLRVYHGLTGVHIGEGEHSIRFVYDDLI